MVVPKTYKVVLNNGEKSASSDFSILMDPRVEESGVSLADLQAQEQLALAVRDLMSEARRMANDISNRKKELAEKKSNKKTQSETAALEFIESQLVTSQGRYQTPMIIDQIRYLSSMIDRADQMPGKDAYERYDELKTRLEALKPDWEKYLSKR